MGFLDNSTNNIIVDAVLTDLGRELLAAQKFDITKFAFGDDEVDYSMIKKFGRTVGKQKIELNTPIFEAQTNQNQALKYRLLTYSKPTLYRLPKLVLQGSETSISMSSTDSDDKSKTLTYKQQLIGEAKIDEDTVDSNFLVKINSKFLKLLPNSLEPTYKDQDGIEQYVLPHTSMEDGRGILQLQLTTKSLSQNIFTFYGDRSNKNQITTSVSVQGLESGARVDTTIVISK